MIRRSFLLAAAASILAAACATDTSIDSDAVQAELEEREASFLEALASRDAERTAAHFADEAVLHVANMAPVEGRDAIREFYGNVFRFMESSASESQVVRASASGDMGHSMGRVTNVFAGQEGPAEYEGKYLRLWERSGTEWLIVAYSISSNSSDAGR